MKGVETPGVVVEEECRDIVNIIEIWNHMLTSDSFLERV